MLERLEPDLPAGARLERRARSAGVPSRGTARARVGFFTTCVMEVMFPRDQPRRGPADGARRARGGGAERADLLRRAPRARRAAAHGEAAGAAQPDRLRRSASTPSSPTRRDAAPRCASTRTCSTTIPPPRPPTSARACATCPRSSRAIRLPEPEAPLGSARDAGRPLRIAYHDPCHLAHAQRVRSEPRALLARLPGVELVDLPHSDWCCGSAGVYNLTHPDMAEAQLAQKLDAIERVAPRSSWPRTRVHAAHGARRTRARNASQGRAPGERAGPRAPAAARRGANHAGMTPPAFSREAVAALFIARQQLDRPRGRRLTAASLTRFVEERRRTPARLDQRARARPLPHGVEPLRSLRPRDPRPPRLPRSGCCTSTGRTRRA